MDRGFRVLAYVVTLGLGCMATTCYDGATPMVYVNCIPGLYCGTNTSETNYVCPPTQACQINRLRGEQCSPQGALEIQLCPQGYYCPTPWEKYLCPEGHFCVKGTVHPIACPTLSSCPEGSYYKREFLGLFLCCLVGVIGAALSVAHGYHRTAASRSKVLPVETPGDTYKPEEECDEWHIARNFVDANDGASIIVLEFQQLTLKVPDGITILDGMSGVIPPGQLTAIMGPSGCGKTSFINVLMNKVDPRLSMTGRVTVNQQEFDKAIAAKVGYAPQEDTMMEDCTVLENIRYSAHIRLKWAADKIENHVQLILKLLNLTDHADSIIGSVEERGISGGQRKRVSIGMELAAAPVALILDEPTSGLDATAALELAKLLSTLASQTGMSIVSVLHQPRREIFDVIDHLLLISQGKTVYAGPAGAEFESHFAALGLVMPEKLNPIDVVMDFIQSDPRASIQAWQDKVVDAGNPTAISLEDALKAADTSGDGKVDIEELEVVLRNIGSGGDVAMQAKLIMSVMDADGGGDLDMDEMRGWVARLKGSVSRATWVKQFVLSHNRSVVQQFRNKTSLVIELGLAMLVGALMGSSYSDDKGNLYSGIIKSSGVFISSTPNEVRVPLGAFLLNLAVGVMAASAGVMSWSNTLPVYWREAGSGHDKTAHFIGLSVSLLWRCILASMLLSALYALLSVPVQTFGTLWGFVLLLYICVYGMSCVVAMVTKQRDSSLLSTILSLLIGTLCGFGPKLTRANDQNWGWVLNLLYSRWFAEAFYSNELHDAYGHIFETDNVSAKIWGWELNRTGLDAFMLILIAILLRVMAFVFMVCLNQDKQR